ncbi:MAG TPA: TVP38/TMEM64 family protein [Kiritimatiellia bacterium]|nr:TVP38/TMEM64 family protein [Kiritimatiellia bacterium]
MKRRFYRRKRTWGGLALIATGVTAVVFWPELSAFFDRLEWERLDDAVRASGRWAPLLCILLNAVFTLLLLPTTLVCILVGLLFNVGPGLTICLAGLGLGMSITFLLARFVVRDWLERRIGHTRLYRRLEENIQRDGWKIVLFSRLFPINPYGFLNYAYGLTRISFWNYLLVSTLGVIPNTLAFLWTVRAAGQLATRQMDWRVLGILSAGALLFAILAWLPRLLARHLPSAIAMAEDEENEPEEDDE